MKTSNKLTAVALGMSLLLGSGMALAHGSDKESTHEVATVQDNARGIEKSDIKRGMKVEKQAATQDDSTKRAGDPIPDIDITLDQAQSVCQAGSDCDDGSASAEHVVQQKAGAKFKAGKALAETVKKVDDSGDDVDHIDEDSDDDGLLDQ